MQLMILQYLDKKVRDLVLKPEIGNYDIEKSLERRYQNFQFEHSLDAKLAGLGSWLNSAGHYLQHQLHPSTRTHARPVVIHTHRRGK